MGEPQLVLINPAEYLLPGGYHLDMMEGSLDRVCGVFPKHNLS